MDGGWGTWDPYDDCTPTCGDRYQTRRRKCNNPKPQNNGKQCDGQSLQTHPCQHVECPGDVVFEYRL